MRNNLSHNYIAVGEEFCRVAIGSNNCDLIWPITPSFLIKEL